MAVVEVAVKTVVKLTAVTMAAVIRLHLLAVLVVVVMGLITRVQTGCRLPVVPPTQVAVAGVVSGAAAKLALVVLVL